MERAFKTVACYDKQYVGNMKTEPFVISLLLFLYRNLLVVAS